MLFVGFDDTLAPLQQTTDSPPGQLTTVSPHMRLFCGILFTMCIFGTPPGAIQGQSPGETGSRLLRLGSWTYEPIEQLRSRGYLPTLNPLSQPYRRIDVAAALQSLRQEDLSQPVADWVDLLEAELKRELSRLDDVEGAEQRAGLQFLVGAVAADSRRKDPLMPFRSEEGEEGGFRDRFWTNHGTAFWLETHNVAAEVRVGKDFWADNGDPDTVSPEGFHQIGRTTDAYFTASFPWGNLWIGTFRRNWGPLGHTGTMLSDNATSYPQIGLDLGSGAFTFQYMAGELLPVAGRKRYLVANRLDYATENLQVALGQAALYSGEAEPLRLMNPVEFIFFDHDGSREVGQSTLTGNLMFNGMFWARVGQGTIYGEGAIDDFDLNPRVGISERGIEATSYQISLGGRYYGAGERTVLGFDYRRVSAWSYRSGPAAEQWTHLDRGLGDRWSDYDRLTVRLDLFPETKGLRLSPVMQYQRAGEGDYRIPFPPREENRVMPGLFHGVLETTTRIAVQGHFQPRRQFFIEWDVGRSFISNAGHIVGTSEQRFSLEIRAALTFEVGLEGSTHDSARSLSPPPNPMSYPHKR
jgi:hypothetical protein